MTQLNAQFAEIPFGASLVQNNTWGWNHPGEIPPQSISGPPGDPVGWTWDWPGADASKVIAYPEVIFGKKPWSAASTSPLLPAKISALGSVMVNYAIDVNATGVFNTAFDLWITNTVQAGEASIRTEIMIWVKRNGLNPAGGSSQLFDTPYGQMRLYEANFDHWKYLAFVFENEIPAANLDLKFFFDFLIEAGRLNPQHFLASIEFGNEIAFGSGTATLNAFSVTVH